MKKVFLFSLILTIFFSACETPRIALLKPSVPEQYIDREGFVTQKSDSLDVTFGYLFSTPDHLVFEVSVKNKSTDSVRVHPASFSFEPTNFSDSTKNVSTFSAQSFTQITDKLDERVRKRHLKTAAVIIVAVVAVVAVDKSLTKHNKRTPRVYNDYSFAVNTGVNLTFNYFDAVMYNQLSKKEARAGLQRSLMFPRKIGPSESHIGVVYFPRCDVAKEMMFNFKTDGHDFKTLFTQKIELR
jgi:hypothetical protein